MGVHPGLLRFVADLEVEAKAEWREVEDARNGVSEHRTERGGWSGLRYPLTLTSM